MQTAFRSRVPSGFGALVMAFLLVVPGLGAQQGGTVTGRVLDAQRGLPIPAVQVFIANLELGGLTQQNGRYLLQNVPAGTHTLSVSRIGYRTTEVQVTVGGGQTVEQDFTMTEEALQLDEIIVTGTAGGTRRRAIGNSVSQVQAAEITEVQAIVNVQQLLAGRSGGSLEFHRLPASVGESSSITIRGTGSFGLGNQPLIYVDGFRVDNSASLGPPTVDSGGGMSALGDINPADIESIEIIKGPAAATLYGTEASAGVIQIITKRGVEGAPEFTFSIRQGMNYMPNPRALIGEQFACRDDRVPPAGGCHADSGLFSFNMYDKATEQIAAGLWDWPSKDIYSDGHSQQYDLSVRGGTANFRYFASGSYQDEQGPIWWNTDEKIRFRTNMSVIFSESLSLDFNGSFGNGNNRAAAPVNRDGGVWVDMVGGRGFCLPDINPGACDVTLGFQEHLPSSVAEIESTRDFSRFTGGLTLNHTYSDWLTQRFVVGIDNLWETNQQLFPLNPEVTGYTETRTGEKLYERPIRNTLSMDYAATVNLDPLPGLLPGFRTSTSVGFQYFESHNENFQNKGFGFASPISTTINQTTAAQLQLTFEDITNKTVGVYVQEEFSLNDRLFLTGAVRFDDNSAFGGDFDFETYPKVSAAWVVSEENFWGIDLVNSMRVRGAWGKSGRQPDTFAGQNIYGVVTGWAGNVGVAPSSPGNPEVGPETSTEIEVGFDIAVLDDRLSGEFTYYNQKNEDALLDIENVPSVGFPGSVQQNLGRIDNWGWEAVLNARIYQSQAASFDITFTADHARNEIKSLGDVAGSNSTQGSSRRLGYPWPNQKTEYTTVSAEYDASGNRGNGNIINAMCDAGVRTGTDADPDNQRGSVRGGEIVRCDALPGPSHSLFGPAYPTYTFTVAPIVGLFNNTLRLYAQAEGQYGETKRDHDSRFRTVYNVSELRNTHDDPRFRASFFFGPWPDHSNVYLTQQNWWKIREVGANYQFSEPLAGRLGAERASLGLTWRMNNVIWRNFTKHYRDNPGAGIIADPEQGNAQERATAASARTTWAEPPVSSVHLTLRVVF